MLTKISVGLALSLAMLAAQAQTSYECKGLMFKSISPNMDISQVPAVKHFNSNLERYAKGSDCDPSIYLRELNPNTMSPGEWAATKSNNQNALRMCEMNGKPSSRP